LTYIDANIRINTNNTNKIVDLNDFLLYIIYSPSSILFKENPVKEYIRIAIPHQKECYCAVLPEQCTAAERAQSQKDHLVPLQNPKFEMFRLMEKEGWTLNDEKMIGMPKDSMSILTFIRESK